MHLNVVLMAKGEVLALVQTTLDHPPLLHLLLSTGITIFSSALKGQVGKVQIVKLASISDTELRLFCNWINQLRYTIQAENGWTDFYMRSVSSPRRVSCR
ncbi:MAG: hypothetical protein DMG30_01440 [Acidobacteria bacterium]|nr:MAG: hypothetical protein DMG30_01440 [Acidobacteriota bacterium]